MYKNVFKSLSEVMLGNIDKIKYYNIFDQIPQYQYCNNTGKTIVAFNKY